MPKRSSSSSSSGATPGRSGPTRTTLIHVADAKGRVTLGSKFSGKLVTVETIDDQIVIRVCAAIPEREAWLYRNPEAIASVRRGLEQAALGDLSDGPDLDAAARLAAELQDDQ